MESLEGLEGPGPLASIATRPGAAAGVFNEGQLLELSAGLLEARSGPALKAALAYLIARTAGQLGASVAPGLASALQHRLAQTAARALPCAGFGPSTANGQRTAVAGRLLGLELERLSPQDK